MKFFLIFLLFCTTAFATEPHFDLPKKDAKEQCKEVERVVSECYKNSDDVDNFRGTLKNCYNMYILYPPAGMDIEEGIIVINKSGMYVGFRSMVSNTPGDIENFIFSNYGEITKIYDKHPHKNQTILTTQSCYIKSIIIN
jgi:hypothetical protein